MQVSWFCQRLAAAIIALTVIGAGLIPTATVAQTPSAEQLKVFQSLPQDQRDAILQQLGMGGGGGSGSGLGGTVRGQDNQIIVQQPRKQLDNNDASNGDENGMSGATKPPARVKGGEQLLIELVLPSDEPSPPSQLVPQQTQPDGRPVPQLSRPRTDPGKRTPDDQRRLEELRDRILRRNPYELTRYGVLQIPGLDAIPLAGLTSREVQERLALDPALSDFTVGVTMLRLDLQGSRALKPFGYDMFKESATAFVPGTDIPVPADYKIGPGDVMDVQLIGQQARSYTIPVGRDGSVNFPSLGPISVGGMGFGAARSMLESRVKQQMIGTQAAVTLSELRSVRVLVLGDAERPGSYVVSALSTVTNALFSSGGVKPIGSLRKIEVRRDGALIRRLDLYDVLLKGDTANDVRLQTGDAVFVPPVGTTVAIDGEVRRPAIYELTTEKTAGELIALAGGLSTEADTHIVTVERIGEHRERTVVSVDLGSTDGRAFPVQAGDLVRIPLIRPQFENGIQLAGHVFHPGTYAFRAGLRLSDVLGSAAELKPRADLHYVLVRRESADSLKVTAQSADLERALRHRGTDADILLEPRDVITVFDLGAPRERIIEPILNAMQRQSDPSGPMSVVSVGGIVNAPGRYPLEPGMRVADLLRAGGGLEDSSYAANAELTRYVVVDGERRRADLAQVDLAAILRGEDSADLPLQPYDVQTVKTIPQWVRADEIEVIGEVRFPGKFKARRGETLHSIIERAGGLTSIAFPQGAVFTREDLKQHEREELDRLANRLQSDLAVLSIQASQTNPVASQSLGAGQSLLDQLKEAKPVGRLVINLERLVADPNSPDAGVIVRNGDRLIVPRLTQVISVLGEVQNPTSHLYRTGLTRDDAIGLSGGTTPRADRKRAYVVRADGSVAGSKSGWFSSGDLGLRPGDTVVVPLDAEKMRPLPMWTAITTIMYNLAIAAAAITHL